MVLAGATQTETSLLKQHAGGERVDLLDDYRRTVFSMNKAQESKQRSTNWRRRHLAGRHATTTTSVAGLWQMRRNENEVERINVLGHRHGRFCNVSRGREEIQRHFISHEHANFLFSVFRVVQGEAKTPKIMGGLQGNFCIFTCLKDWHFSWEMNIRMSVQNLTILSPGSLFFNQQQTCFFLCMFLNDAYWELQINFDLEHRAV